MRTLYGMLLRAFLPVFIASSLFFMLALELVDLFANLFRYLKMDVAADDIFYLAFLYLPKCFHFSLPMSLLFSIAFILGTYYANNELISAFTSGISLQRLTMPFLLGGIVISVMNFFFEDQVVIPAYKKKMEMQKVILHEQSDLSRSNLAIISRGGQHIYYADYYNDRQQTLTGLILLERNEQGKLIRRWDSRKAQWKEKEWVLTGARLYYWDAELDSMTERYYQEIGVPEFQEPPETFQDKEQEWDQMTLKEAQRRIRKLRRTGLPSREIRTDYYKRYAFSLTPLVVILVSCAMGGRFKKNILLMSLLASLVISVVYYVVQMVAVLMAKLGYLPPAVGAWTAIGLSMAVGGILFKTAKT